MRAGDVLQYEVDGKPVPAVVKSVFREVAAGDITFDKAGDHGIIYSRLNLAPGFSVPLAMPDGIAEKPSDDGDDEIFFYVTAPRPEVGPGVPVRLMTYAEYHSVLEQRQKDRHKNEGLGPLPLVVVGRVTMKDVDEKIMNNPKLLVCKTGR